MMQRTIAPAFLAALGFSCAGPDGRIPLGSVREGLRAPDGEVVRGSGPGGRPWSVRKTTLRGGSQEGVEVTLLEDAPAVERIRREIAALQAPAPPKMLPRTPGSP